MININTNIILKKHPSIRILLVVKTKEKNYNHKYKRHAVDKNQGPLLFAPKKLWLKKRLTTNKRERHTQTQTSQAEVEEEEKKSESGN